MKVDVKVPAVGESISEVVIARWLKADGEMVKMDEPICEIDSEKATFEVPAEASGKIKILVKEGETVPVGATIAQIDTDQAVEPIAEKKPAAEAAKETPAPQPEVAEGPEKIAVKEETAAAEAGRITPVAEKILREAGISWEGIRGSGPGGKITKEDALELLQKVKEKQESLQAEPKTAEAEEKITAPRVKLEGEPSRTIRRERMSTLRKTLARHLVEAKNQTAMLTTFNEVDMSAIIQARQQYKELFTKKHEVGLGFMSFFVKACTIALMEMPIVNAQIDGDDIVYHDFCDISIAVSTDRGLVVPVIRNAERLSFAEIEAEIERLANKARSNRLTIEEMTGGTFTITNGGVFGSLMATPIINAPQTAILGMHKIQERPVVVNGEIVVRPMMYVALSYDHRLIDGRESVTFLVRVKELLEDPIRMLIGV